MTDFRTQTMSAADFFARQAVVPAWMRDAVGSAATVTVVYRDTFAGSFVVSVAPAGSAP